MNKNSYINTVLIILNIFVILVLGIYFLKANIKSKNEQEKINYELNISIDYPIINNQKFDEYVANKIDNKVKEYKEKINYIEANRKTEEYIVYNFKLNSDIKNKFDIEYVNLEYAMDIYDNELLVIKKETDIDNFIYSTAENNEIDFSYYFDDETYLDDISIISEYYLKSYLDKNNLKYDNEYIKKITAKKIENYNNNIFSDIGLEIIFKYQYEENGKQIDITITIPYNEINYILKEKYCFNVEKVYKSNTNPIRRPLQKYRGKKLIAITFDDGPSNYTTNILLDGLKKYDARVTFFVLGQNVRNNKEVIKRAYLEGNEIANHSYSHQNFFKLNYNEIEEEIEKTNEEIYSVIGVKPKLIRPPYGNTNKEIAKIGNMYTIRWNVDTEDWKYKDANNVKNEILKYARDGYIVLLHDIYETSVYGAIDAIQVLKAQGYEFVTVSEMVMIKNIELKVGTSYFSFHNK